MSDAPFVREWLRRERRVAQAVERIETALGELPKDKARRVLNAAAACYDIEPPCPAEQP